MREKNFMFGDIVTRCYMLLCLLGFVVGVFCHCAFSRGKLTLSAKRQDIPVRGIAHYRFSMSALLLSIGLNIAYLSIVSREFRDIWDLYFGGRGHLLRAEVLGLYLPVPVRYSYEVGFAVVMWVYANYIQGHDMLSSPRRNILTIAMATAILLQTVSCIVGLARFRLMPFVVSLGIAYLYSALQRGQLSLARLAHACVLGLLLIMLLFGLVGFFRGAVGANQLVEAYVGYGPASINRLSAIINGQLDMPDRASTFYTLGAFWYPPFVEKAIDMKYLGQILLGVALPDSRYENWASQFASVWAAGLNSSYIWPTVYGCAYLDFGWLGAAYFALYGFLSWALFKSFVMRNAFGVVMYPLVVFCILFWFGDNYVVYPEVYRIGYLSLVLCLVDKLSSKI